MTEELRQIVIQYEGRIALIRVTEPDMIYEKTGLNERIGDITKRQLVFLLTGEKNVE